MELLKRYIEQLAAEMEIRESLESTKIPGTYLFPIDENTETEIREDPSGIHLFCSVCPAPAKNMEDFLQHALHANLFGQGTMGTTLALDSSGKQLTLSQDLDYNIDYEHFKEKLEDFLNAVEIWREEAASFESGKTR